MRIRVGNKSGRNAHLSEVLKYGIRNLLTAEWASGMRGNGENSASRIFERLQTDGRALIQRARGEFRKYFFRIAQTRDTEISRVTLRVYITITCIILYYNVRRSTYKFRFA